MGQGELRWYWSYHHAVAINVEGALRVLDLSIGDEPIPVAEWTRGFVEPSIECAHLSDTEHGAVSRYFVPAFANLIPGKRPERACGYNFTRIFTFAPGREPQVESVLLAAETMQVQHGAMRTLLSELGATLDREQFPLVRSRYTPRSEAELCAWNRLSYCDLLEREEP